MAKVLASVGDSVFRSLKLKVKIATIRIMICCSTVPRDIINSLPLGVS